MQVTIKVPSFKLLTSALRKVEGAFKTSKPALDYGCYKDDEGNWFSYWVVNDTCHVEPTPEGLNSKEYAATRLGTEGTHSYTCGCDKCHNTGSIYGGKCFKCDGKGWMSPIDVSRFAKFEARQAPSKPKAKARKKAA